MIITNPKILRKLFLTSWFIYFISYIGRLNYAASMLAIGQAEGYSTSQLGLVVTALFISYGLGQLLSGVLGDKFCPIKLITFGLALCSLCNLLMALSTDFYQLIVIWFVNGVALAFVWPPMAKIFSRHMPKAYLKKSCFHIQTSVALGTFFTYLCCSSIIYFFDWRWVFYFASLLLFIGSIVAYIFYTRIATYGRLSPNTAEISLTNNIKTASVSSTKPFSFTLLIQSGFIIILGAILVMGFLKDGIMTWIPQYLTDTFKLSTYFSICLSALLPLVNLTGIYVGQFIYHHTGEDDLKTAGLLYIISTLSFIGLILYGDYNVVISLVLFACITSCMLGINTIFVNVIPTYFEAYGKTSTVAGITNSTTYLGSALCGYGLGALIESYGWHTARILLLLTCFFALVVCSLALKKWNLFKASL